MRDKIILEKMHRYTTKILNYCDALGFAEFRRNEMLLEACIFNLSQIGELTTKLGENFKAAHPEITWHQIYGLRNRIVHDYEGVNLQLIWEIITEDMPKLQRELENLKKKI